MAFQEAVAKSSKYSDCETWNAKGKLNPNDQLEGYYYDREDFTTKYGDMMIAIIKQGDQFIKVVGQSDIKNKFAEIPFGAKVQITYVGLVEVDRGTKKAYKVMFDPEDTIETERKEK